MKAPLSPSICLCIFFSCSAASNEQAPEPAYTGHVAQEALPHEKIVLPKNHKRRPFYETLEPCSPERYPHTVNYWLKAKDKGDNEKTTKEVLEDDKKWRLQGFKDFQKVARENKLPTKFINIIKRNINNSIPISESWTLNYVGEEFIITYIPHSVEVLRYRFKSPDAFVFTYDKTEAINPNSKRAWFDFSAEDYKPFLQKYQSVLPEVNTTEHHKMMRYLNEVSKVMSRPSLYTGKKLKDVLLDPQKEATADNIIISGDDLEYFYALSTTMNRNFHYFYGEKIKEINKETGWNMQNPYDKACLWGRAFFNKHTQHGAFDLILQGDELKELKQNKHLLYMTQITGLPIYTLWGLYDPNIGHNTSGEGCYPTGGHRIEGYSGQEFYIRYFSKTNSKNPQIPKETHTLMMPYNLSDSVRLLTHELKANKVDLENLGANKSYKQQVLALYALHTMYELYIITSQVFDKKLTSFNYLYEIISFPQKATIEQLQGKLPRIKEFFFHKVASNYTLRPKKQPIAFIRKSMGINPPIAEGAALKTIDPSLMDQKAKPDTTPQAKDAMEGVGSEYSHKVLAKVKPLTGSINLNADYYIYLTIIPIQTNNHSTRSHLTHYNTSDIIKFIQEYEKIKRHNIELVLLCLTENNRDALAFTKKHHIQFPMIRLYQPSSINSLRVHTKYSLTPRYACQACICPSASITSASGELLIAGDCSVVLDWESTIEKAKKNSEPTVKRKKLPARLAKVKPFFNKINLNADYYIFVQIDGFTRYPQSSYRKYTKLYNELKKHNIELIIFDWQAAHSELLATLKRAPNKKLPFQMPIVKTSALLQELFYSDGHSKFYSADGAPLHDNYHKWYSWTLKESHLHYWKKLLDKHKEKQKSAE